MKIKELKRTVNVSWSPAELQNVYLAAGSAAQQVDASFSSNSYLELYSLNLEDPGLDLELKSSLQTQHRFQKLVWSGANILVGGCDGGLLEFYSGEKLLAGSKDALLGSSTKHSGHVSALDINPYQKNLLASGASESEIFIWDLNNTSQPMAPGNRSQPFDHVQGLAWNQQVQHILGSTFATRCVVWDLRKNEPIMKLSDAQSRTRWRALAWHPAVATQLCIASEDDQVPVIQLWDLRLAASPLATLEGHRKGALALAWCRQDADLLLSAGKDGRVLCWNPNNTQPGGELLSEISQQQQWVFEVLWCPRNPNLLASAAFDQHLDVHSLLGGSTPAVSSATANNIMESFGGAHTFSRLPAVARAQPPPPAAAAQPPRAPRWLRRPSGAKFSFGGKLVTFDKCPQDTDPGRHVYISQVVSEPEIVEKATELDTVLSLTLSQDPSASERLAEYCRARGDAATAQGERYSWFLLRANFLPGFREEVLNLLGFKQDDIPSKFKGLSLSGDSAPNDVAAAALSRDAHTLIERKLSSVDQGPTVNNVFIPNGEDTTSMICRALVCGNLEEAVELCLEAKRVADALIVASLGSQELLYKVQKYHLNHSASDPVSLLAGSLLLSRWEALVQAASSHSWRETLAAILTHCEPALLSHYCEMLGDKLSKESEPSLSEAATTCYLCAMQPEALVSRWRNSTRTDDVTALASLTEKTLLVRRAALARGTLAEASSALEGVVCEYAARLAAQGCLQAALAALEAAPAAALRARLQRALGLASADQKTHHAPAHSARSRTTSAHAHAHGPRRSHGHVLAHNDVSSTYSAVPAQYDAQQSWQNASVPASSTTPGYANLSNMQPGVPAAGSAQPVANAHPVANVPSAVQPVQPPRAPSTGPVASGGITSRSKYKVDPSVQSAPLYNQYSFNNHQQQQFGYNSPLPDQYNSGTVAGFTPINPVNQTHQINPTSSNMNNGYYTPAQAPPAEAPAPAPPAARPAPPGWNDPPMLTNTKPKPKPEVQTQAPITHPLFGVEPPQHIPLNPYPGQQQYPGQPQQYPGQQQQYPGQQQQYPGQQQQYPGQQQQYPEQQYNQQIPGQYQNQGYPAQAESPAPAEPVRVQKAAIPEQHVVLQTTFDALRNECYSRATNPQMKRKLDDVQKKLEALYDLLRDYRLSESALSSLHSCVQCASAGDYESATSVATALATGPDFAAVASFLPGLKVLFLLAQQLQVYLR